VSAAPVLARTLKYQVRISRGDGAGTLFHFDQGIVSIGRGAENDIVLANDPKVSRQHLELRIQSGSLLVKNVSKKNFVLVNGETVDEKLCEQNFKLQVGATELDIQLELPPASPSTAKEARPKTLSIVSENYPLDYPLSSEVVEPVPVSAAFPVQQSPLQPIQTATSAPKKSSALPPNQNYSARVTKSSAPPRGPRNSTHRIATNSGGNSRVRFYVIVAIVVGAFLWLMTGPVGSKPKEANLRSEADVLRSIEESATAVKDLKQQQQNSGKDTMQYQLAEQNYVKGFRDYLQGQYARSIVSFQAALSFYPQHEMARKYLILSQRKFDESIDQSMSMGRSYYKRQNWRMCQSSFANVMISLKDPAKAKYKEAKQIYDECSLRLGGGY